MNVYGTSCNLCLFTGGFARANIAIGCECQGATLLSEGKIPQMRGSINEVPSEIFTGRRGASPNHMWMPKSPWRRCRSINPCSESGYFVAVQSAGRISRFMQRVQFYESIEKMIMFMTGPVSRRHLAVCKLMVVISYETRSLYVVLAVIEIMENSIGNASGFYRNTVALGGRARRESVVD